MIHLVILLYAAIAAIAFIISGQALLFWLNKRRTRLVLAQFVYFACEFARYVILAFVVNKADAERTSLIVTSAVLLLAMVGYAYEYWRRNVDG